ncbi:hypothetical protein BU16DRAFT_27845 [Lophium mytilinum]|uniref:Heterokaryon incompatibility domain-containing protein n=1 Tax=Lophium mytilinum TaxID=390894 RepID=A0A6A6RE69_9PEZI|nr:hypothetical protein BU16DRAFT_27845 [Lophium mytilinum]
MAINMRRGTVGAEPKKRGLLTRFQTKIHKKSRSLLCDTCRSIDINSTLPLNSSHATPPLPSNPASAVRTPKPVVLGSYNDLLSNASCPCCQLFLHLLRQDEASNSATLINNGDIGCATSAKYELQRSKHGFEVKDATGTQGYVLPASQDMPSISSNISSGTPVPALDAACVRGWLSDCETTHVTCGIMDDSLHTNDPVDIILIDVRNNCIVKGNTHQRYLALSYARGGVRCLEASKANFDIIQRDGALDQQKLRLPRVIEDAMKLTLSLGERYLWAHCLSIVQDDDIHKKAQINRMHEIFGQAAMTIVAATRRDPHSRLPGVGAGTRASYLAEKTIKGRTFVARPANLRALLEHGSYGDEAWAYQERILSRRCLILTQHQAYFHCQTATQTEAADCDSEDILLALDMPSNPLAMVQTERSLDGMSQPDTFSKEAMSLYSSLVQSSTRRHLSHPTDRLAAFAGISTILKSCYGSPSIAGLPEAILDAALLWVASTPQAPTHRIRSLPSWSWASHHGSVDYLSGPLASTLHKNSPPIRSEIGAIVLRTQKHLHPVSRVYSDLIQKLRMDSATTSDVGEIPTPFISRDVETLCFSARVANVDRFHIRAFEWDAGRVLVYSKGSTSTASPHPTCCGKIWPDNAAAFAEARLVLEPGVRRELVLLSSVRVPDMAEHLGLGKHFAVGAFAAGVLMNVLLVEWRGDYAERIGVGQVHEGAWEAVEEGQRGIVLV